MSTHSVDVLKVEEVLKHPNADALEIIKAYDYECVVKLGDFKPGDLFLFIHPDSMVDTKREEFAFLAPKANEEGKARIRSIRLRQVRSYGLVLKAPKEAKLGDNYWDKLGIEQYEPPFQRRGVTGEGGVKSGYQAKAPAIVAPVPDPENIRRFKNVIPEGENVMYTAKTHGSFFRATYQDGEFHVGSKNTWKMKPGNFAGYSPKRKIEKVLSVVHSFASFAMGGALAVAILSIIVGLDWTDIIWALLFALSVCGVRFLESKMNECQAKRKIVAPYNSWWAAFEQNEWLGKWLIENPGATVLGELYGPGVQGIRFPYGKEEGKYGIAVFDVHEGGKFVDQLDLHHGERYKTLEKVLLLHEGPHDKELMKSLAELPESFNECKHIREGLVVKPWHERRDLAVGRVVLKYIADTYLERT